MKRLFLLILSACFIAQTGIGQIRERSGAGFLFQGLVMDAGTLIPVGNSRITINRVFSSFSESNGTFAFFVNKNDTVVFNSLGYKQTILLISDTLLGREFVAGIFMKSDTLSIGEVVIVPRFSNIKSEILNAPSKTSPTMENARYNVAVSAYAGRNSINKLGDPSSNYEMLRQRQKVDAYEKGGIPSDKILGFSPLILLPAAYMLMKGLPEKPAPITPRLTDSEISQVQKKYFEMLKQRK